jgi:cellulose synthase/poly-beta-1,6-N-acetylglucosamine synthase-like glycosyltransferase
MNEIATTLVAAPAVLFGYAYLGYPALLRSVAAMRPAPTRWDDPSEWPSVTITVPVYNEQVVIRRTIDQLLAVDYPPERRRIIVISDASTDGTDDVVREYAGRGVELLRLEKRSGKTAAENAVAGMVSGEIVVNVDATTRILPQSLKPLIRVFQDPMVGVASGRDVSAGAANPDDLNSGETGYVGYEMWVRAQETRVGSIVGVSGCFYAIRRSLYENHFPESLSRDFGCVLSARQRGYRAVSVDEAVCIVPRTSSLQAEFRRKIRTMQRGLKTLWFKRRLLDPIRFGGFALMLASHKLARWLVPLTLPTALLGLTVLALESRIALALLVGAAIGIAMGSVGMLWPESRRMPRLLAIPAFALAANVAGFRAWLEALRPGHGKMWEPTRRPV